MNYKKILQIINKINSIWITKYLRTIDDTSVIFDLCHDIDNIPEVTNTKLGDFKRVLYHDLDGETNFMLEYNLLIEINNLKLNSKIRLIPNDDYGYHIILCLKNDLRVTESLLTNNEFSIKSFVKELKQCKSFNDVKTTFKNYAVEAILIGSLLSAVLCNFSLSDSQIKELCDNDVIHSELFYILDNEKPFINKQLPQWELLCDDTEATVYHAKKEQCNDDVQYTASMFKLNLQNPESHRIIAMERSMMKQYGLKYGDIIKIEGSDSSRDGIYQIQDTMNKRFKGKHKIDILINNDSKIGKWNNVKIYKLTNPKEFYNFFKENMADALNQSWINLRLKK